MVDKRLGCGKWLVFTQDNHQWIETDKKAIVTNFRPMELRSYKFKCGSGRFRRVNNITEDLGRERIGTAYLCKTCLIKEGFLW